MKKGLIITSAVLAILLLLVLINPLQWFLVKMKIEEQCGINVTNESPITAKVDENVVIRMLDKLKTTIRVDQPLSIQLDEVIDVPLKMELPVELKTDVYMDETLALKFDLPLNVNLSPQELQLSNLKIPFNQSLYIEDELAVDFMLEMDTKIKTKILGIPLKIPAQGMIPVKTVIPIRQALKVRDTITLSPIDYNIVFNAIIPVDVKVPIAQKVNINGNIVVPVDQMVSIPLKKNITAPVLQTFDATVDVNNAVGVGFETDLKATASFTDTMKVKMGVLTIEPSKLKIVKK